MTLEFEDKYYEKINSLFPSKPRRLFQYDENVEQIEIGQRP